MGDILEQFNVYAFVDITLIAFVIYHLLILIRGTRAAQILTGILIIFGAFFLVSQFYPLTTLKWMLNKFYSSFIIVIVIIFQEDIRLMLSRMGKKPLLPGGEGFSSKQIVDEIIRASYNLAQRRIGALIVLERNIILDRYVEIGVKLDARVSRDLLMAIFHPTAPIHDGAVIIQHGRCSAAGCFLPLTRDENLDPNLGTRNRAAMGVSQETDALVVLVSEEEGSVSLVVEGTPRRDLEAKELRKLLWKHLNPDRSTSNETTETRFMLTNLKKFFQRTLSK
jgi:diadenylate cyclase